MTLRHPETENHGSGSVPSSMVATSTWHVFSPNWDALLCKIHTGFQSLIPQPPKVKYLTNIVKYWWPVKITIFWRYWFKINFTRLLFKRGCENISSGKCGSHSLGGTGLVCMVESLRTWCLSLGNLREFVFLTCLDEWMRLISNTWLPLTYHGTLSKRFHFPGSR